MDLSREMEEPTARNTKLKSACSGDWANLIHKKPVQAWQRSRHYPGPADSQQLSKGAIPGKQKPGKKGTEECHQREAISTLERLATSHSKHHFWLCTNRHQTRGNSREKTSASPRVPPSGRKEGNRLKPKCLNANAREGLTKEKVLR